MLAPVSGLVIFIVGGIGAVAAKLAFTTADKVGPQLTLKDLRPAAPWEGLPLPIFFYTKPEVMRELRR